MRQALVASAALLLFNCTHFLFPRSTYIRKGAEFDGGVGVASGANAFTDYPDEIAILGCARLGVNPSERLSFDLCAYGELYPQVPGREGHLTVFVPSLSLTTKVRPAPRVNSMLFFDWGPQAWYAGIAQGIPFTGPEVITLGLNAGTWAWKEGISGFPEYYFQPNLDMILGSVSWHSRAGGTRLTASLVGGYYGLGDLFHGRWYFAFTISGAGREPDTDQVFESSSVK